MGGVLSSPTTEAYPFEKIFLNHVILDIILKHVLLQERKWRGFQLSPKEGCRLRQVCLLWNHRICAIFLRHRQPLLSFITGMNSCPFKDLFEQMTPNRELHGVGSLPPFAMDTFYCGHKIVGLAGHWSTLLVTLDGGRTLIKFLYRENCNLTHLQQMFPVFPTSVQFPVLQSLTWLMEVGRNEVTGKAVLPEPIANFFQHFLSSSPELKSLVIQAGDWPLEVLPRGPLSLEGLTELQLLAKEHISEEGLLRMLERCRQSLTYLFLQVEESQRKNKEPGLDLDLDRWPVLPKLGKITINGPLSLDNPLLDNTPDNIKRKFPALTEFDHMVNREEAWF